MNEIVLTEWAWTAVRAELAARVLNGPALPQAIQVEATPGGLRLRPRGIVGVWTNGAVTLRIHPKVDALNVLGLLAYASGRVDLLDHEVEVSRSDDFIELLLRIFVRKTTVLARRGWIGGYLERVDELRVVRGRLLVDREIVKLPHQRASMACRFEEFTTDVPPNRVIKQALQRVAASGPVSPAMAREARKLAATMPEVAANDDVDAATRVCERDRRFDGYGSALEIAALILHEAGIEQARGAVSLNSFLIGMPMLFERAVTRAFRRVAEQSGLTVSAQEVMYLDRQELLEIRPDILVRAGGAVQIVVDAKYVDPGGGLPDASNFQQVIAYLGRVRCEHAALVLPVVGEEIGVSVHEVDAFGRALAIQVVTVPLAGDAARIGQRLEEAARRAIERPEMIRRRVA